MREFLAKRIYDKRSADDGLRLLVDRLWPRGVSKKVAHIDLWPKELTPSNELRKWFHEHLDQYDEFASRYRLELHERLDEIIGLFATIDAQRLTLVTSTKDLEHGHVAVLMDFLKAHFAGGIRS
jgi:uncharacterized protein YeaO (DUF488 family)